MTEWTQADWEAALREHPRWHGEATTDWFDRVRGRTPSPARAGTSPRGGRSQVERIDAIWRGEPDAPRDAGEDAE